MQNKLNTTLAIGSFITMSTVPGLWDYLHDRFLTTNSVPSTPGFFNVYTTFAPTISVTYKSNYYTQQLVVRNSGNAILSIVSSVNRSNDSILSAKTAWVWENYGTLSVNDRAVILPALVALIQYPYACAQYGGPTITAISAGLCTGSYPTSTVIPPVSPVIDDGNVDRPINLPADPRVFDMATKDTVFTDRNGIQSTVIPSTTVQQQTGEVDADRAARAAAAALAAVAAALAAGHTQPAADAAGVAASNAIMAGQTAADAVRAGSVAASNFAANVTGVLTSEGLITSITSLFVPVDTTIIQANITAVITAFADVFPFSLQGDLHNIFYPPDGGLNYPQIGYWQYDPDGVQRYHIVFDFGSPQHKSMSDQLRVILTLGLYLGFTTGMLSFQLRRQR